MNETPFQIFNKWIFDENPSSIIPEILIEKEFANNAFLSKLFLKNPNYSIFMNDYFNNYSIFSLERKEFLLFLKQIILDLKIKRYDMVYFPFQPLKKLNSILEEHYPCLKDYDIELLADNIMSSSNRDNILLSLGMEKIEKVKKLKSKKKNEKIEKISQEEFISQFFQIIF